MEVTALGRKPEAAIRINKALREGRLTWTELLNKTRLGKAPLFKNLKDMMARGEVGYAVDPNSHPARGYYELNESGMRLADLDEFIKRIEKGFNIMQDKYPSLLDNLAENMLMNKFDEAVERYISSLYSSAEAKATFRKNWLEPYKKIFTKVWLEFSIDSMKRIQEILAITFVLRSLYNSIPVSFQKSKTETKKEYERFIQEMNNAVKSESEIFFKSYPEYIEKNLAILIKNLDDLIIVKEFLKFKEKNPNEIQDYTKQFRKIWEEKLKPVEGKLRSVDQPLQDAIELLNK